MKKYFDQKKTEKFVIDLARKAGFLLIDKSEINSNDLNKDQIMQIMSLSGVRQYPMRVKCATLSWHTLISAINNTQEEINTEKFD